MNRLLIPLALLLLTVSAPAMASDLSSIITIPFCKFYGVVGGKPVIAVIAGLCAVVFAVLLMVGEGGQHMTTVLRILLAIAIMIAIPELIGQVVGASMCSGSSSGGVLGQAPVTPLYAQYQPLTNHG